MKERTSSINKIGTTANLTEYKADTGQPLCQPQQPG